MPLLPPTGAAPSPPPPAAGPPAAGPPPDVAPGQGAGPPDVAPAPPQQGAVPRSERPVRAEGEIDPQQLDDFEDKAFELIYGGETGDGELAAPISSMLRHGANDQTQALADTAAQVVGTVITSATESGVSLDPAVALAGLSAVVSELANAAEIVGIYDFGQDEIDAAAARAGESLYPMVQDQGVFAQEEAMIDAGDIAQASKTGEMDDAIRRLEGESGVPGGPGIMGRGM